MEILIWILIWLVLILGYSLYSYRCKCYELVLLIHFLDQTHEYDYTESQLVNMMPWEGCKTRELLNQGRELGFIHGIKITLRGQRWLNNAI